jgi:hypothetical protein
MSIEGRINVDVLFHDKDGTASLKVVSLQDSQAYTSGKVAVVSGTCGTSAVTIQVAPTAYRDASGALVSFFEIQRFVIKSGPAGLIVNNPTVTVDANSLTVVSNATGDFDDAGQLPTVRTNAGTSSYTIAMYGT